MIYLHFFIYFTIYSFAGWIIETIYRSFAQKKFVNAGLLYGFFVPLYGVATVLIIVIDRNLLCNNLVIKFFIYGTLITAVEYITGFFSEALFKIKLWDYSDNKINLHGRVCLSFSIGWAILSLLFINAIHPYTEKMVFSLEQSLLAIISAIFLIYFIVDFTFSIALVLDFRKKLIYIYDEYISMDQDELNKILNSFKRIVEAFPRLRKYLFDNIQLGLKPKIGSIISKIDTSMKNIQNGDKADLQEYNEIVSDILQHKEFQRLQDFFHHNSSIFDHVKKVSYLSYKLCKFLKFDYVSAARGGLLHDFFLYDWRNHDLPELAKEKFHGLHHPAIALENSEKYFKLNKIEKDIILKHMWPLTLTPPFYRESVIVTMADKYISSEEFTRSFTEKVKSKIKKG